MFLFYWLLSLLIGILYIIQFEVPRWAYCIPILLMFILCLLTDLYYKMEIGNAD